MSGICCGSARAETYAGSQAHRAWNYIDDPLLGNIQEFMSTIIAAGFGPVNVPFLSTVSQFTGTGYNALAAVATIPLPPVFPVDVLIDGQPQRWFLVAGTTSGATGIIIPNDYNPITNAKYWIQLE